MASRDNMSFTISQMQSKLTDMQRSRTLSKGTDLEMTQMLELADIDVQAAVMATPRAIKETVIISKKNKEPEERKKTYKTWKF